MVLLSGDDMRDEVEIKVGTGPINNEETFDHPAFGQVEIHRVETNARLGMYGANSQLHPTYLMFRVFHSQRSHNFGSDYFFSKNPPIVEFHMTPLQFSDLLTQMNYGSGVPCTLRTINGEGVPRIPITDKTEIERVRQSFVDSVRDLTDKMKLDAMINEIEEILSGKTIKKADKKRILDLVSKIRTEVSSNLPFLLRSFISSAEKVQGEVKKEISSFVTLVSNHFGRSVIGGKNILEMTSGADKEEK